LCDYFDIVWLKNNGFSIETMRADSSVRMPCSGNHKSLMKPDIQGGALPLPP
jgi:hypothetical protein